MAVVSLEHVYKRFDNDVIAVNDFNLEIKDKEFVVFVGPSGCGKSTTLRMIAGLEEISEGNIYIGDRMVNDVAPKDRDIAMVFQSYALYPHMNVYENMAFGLKLRKFPKDEIDRRVREAAAILGIEHLLDRKPKQLSGGQRQRVAMGRAIVREPKVFLMDEPLSNLDAKLRGQMRAEISKLHNRLQTTTIYVTHDQIEAMTLGDRIVVMKDGIIQQVDSPLNIYENPANIFVAGFMGSPTMNFFDCVLREEEGKVTLDGSTFKLIVPEDVVNGLQNLRAYLGKEVVLGIRPENIEDRMFADPDNITEGSIIKGTVDVFEPIGSEVYLHLSQGKHTFTARVDAHTQVKDGDVVDIVFDMKKVKFFAKDTGRTIS